MLASNREFIWRKYLDENDSFNLYVIIVNKVLGLHFRLFSMLVEISSSARLILRTYFYIKFTIIFLSPSSGKYEPSNFICIMKNRGKYFLLKLFSYVSPMFFQYWTSDNVLLAYQRHFNEEWISNDVRTSEHDRRKCSLVAQISFTLLRPCIFLRYKLYTYKTTRINNKILMKLKKNKAKLYEGKFQ